jgi:hypothetical protein
MRKSGSAWKNGFPSLERIEREHADEQAQQDADNTCAAEQQAKRVIAIGIASIVSLRVRTSGVVSAT